MIVYERRECGWFVSKIFESIKDLDEGEIVKN